MAGVSVLLAGDFRQTRPVISRGAVADELEACLKSSALWKHVIRIGLRTNVRVDLQGDSTAGHFVAELLTIGNGKAPVDRSAGLLHFPDHFCNIVDSMEALKNCVFSSIQENGKDHQWLCERTILAPKNYSANTINLQIQEELPGSTKSYNSMDTVVYVNDLAHYSIEWLNSLEPSGMQLHNELFKIDSPIMLLRNLDTPRLCNSSRLIVKKSYAACYRDDHSNKLRKG
jgi:hypothetical protein